jgi:hypothetical protein
MEEGEIRKHQVVASSTSSSSASSSSCFSPPGLKKKKKHTAKSESFDDLSGSGKKRKREEQDEAEPKAKKVKKAMPPSVKDYLATDRAFIQSIELTPAERKIKRGATTASKRFIKRYIYQSRSESPRDKKLAKAQAELDRLRAEM